MVLCPERDLSGVKISVNRSISKELTSSEWQTYRVWDEEQRLPVSALDLCTFDETSYFGTSNEPNTYLSVNYDERVLKSYAIEIGAERRLKSRLLYKLKANPETRSIRSHSVSRLIRGETAVLLDDELHLMSAERADDKSMRLTGELLPRSSVAQSSNWQSVRFANDAHPRAFLYSDPTQYVYIDCRIPQHSDRTDLWTFQLQRTYLLPNETILQTSLHFFSYNLVKLSLDAICLIGLFSIDFSFYVSCFSGQVLLGFSSLFIIIITSERVFRIIK